MVSSSDLESSHSNVADSLPLQVQKQLHLQPIRTVLGVHAHSSATSAHVRFDERASHGWPDNTSGSLRGQQDTQQPSMFQASDEDVLPRKLSIRRVPKSQAPQQQPRCMPGPSPPGQHVPLMFQAQQHAPSPIIEEPYEPDAGFNNRHARQHAPGFASNPYAQYRHSTSNPTSKLSHPGSPGCKRRFDMHGFEMGDGMHGARAFGVEGSRVDMWDSANFNDMAHRTQHAQPPMSPRSVTDPASPQKLSIRPRRLNQESGCTGALCLAGCACGVSVCAQCTTVCMLCLSDMHTYQ